MLSEDGKIILMKVRNSYDVYKALVDDRNGIWPSKKRLEILFRM